MSWSLSFELQRYPDDLTAGRDLMRATPKDNIGNSQAETERNEQVKRAIDAVSDLFESPIFENAKVVGINLSGHANPENKGASGWSNESINISIFVKKYKEPVEVG